MLLCCFALGWLQLGDFGVARVITDKATTFAGTPLCMAPEVLMGTAYTHKSDVWSLGVLIYELITRSPLVTARTIDSLKIKVCRTLFQKFLVDYTCIADFIIVRVARLIGKADVPLSVLIVFCLRSVQKYFTNVRRSFGALTFFLR